MTRKIAFISLFLLFICSTYAPAQKLFNPYAKNVKFDDIIPICFDSYRMSCGLFDLRKKTFITDYQYELSLIIANDYIPFSDNDKKTYSYLNVKNGSIAPVHNKYPIPFSPDGTVPYLSVTKTSEGKFGVMDKSGKIIIPEQFKRIGHFSKNGLAPALRIDKEGVQQNGVINNKGQFRTFDLLITGEFSENGLIPIKSPDSLFGFADAKENIIVKPQFQSVRSFNNGFAVIKQNDKFGYIDETGKIVVPAQYVTALDFGRCGLAPVEKQDGSWVYIHPNGDTINNQHYDRAEPFADDGLAVVLRPHFSDGTTIDGFVFINAQGKVVIAKHGTEGFDREPLPFNGGKYTTFVPGSESGDERYDGDFQLYYNREGEIVADSRILEDADPTIVDSNKEIVWSKTRNDIGEETFNLFTAIGKGDLPTVRTSLKKGLDVNVKGPDGVSPLLMATIARQPEIVKFLLQSGANPDHITKDNVTPLAAASSLNDRTIFDLLIAAGASCNLVEGDESPLSTAALMGNANLVDTLLAKGAKVTENSIDNALRGGNEKIVQRLLKQRGEKLQSDPTPLFEAISAGNKDIVRLLLEQGTNANIQNKDGRIPLIAAIQKNQGEIAEILLDAGAKVNARNKQGDSALTVAVEKQSLKLVKNLLAAGANPNSRFSDATKMPVLLKAVCLGNTDMVTQLLEAGADINATSSDESGGMSPIIAAAAKHHHKIVNQLIAAGADVNQATTHSNDHTIHSKGDLPYCETKDTALICSIDTLLGHYLPPTIDELLLAGADIDAEDIDRSTALIEAATWEAYAVFEYLLHHGANLLNSKGESVIERIVKTFNGVNATERRNKLLQIIHSDPDKQVFHCSLYKEQVKTPFREEYILAASQQTAEKIIKFKSWNSITLKKTNITKISCETHADIISEIDRITPGKEPSHKNGSVPFVPIPIF